MPYRLALIGVLLLAAISAHAWQVTDDRGMLVTAASAPKRVVSMLPALTEAVCALGQCGRLVGVDRYSDWPKSVMRLPKLGGGLDPNIEAIVALKPDLVLVATSSRASDRLRALGLTVLAFEPHNYKDVWHMMSVLGVVLDLPATASAQMRAKLESDVAVIAQSLAASPEIKTKLKNTQVYFEVNRAPYGAGEASFLGETLARLGVKNILPTALGEFPKLNPEFIVRANPDLIMVGQEDSVGMNQRPGWQFIKAVREHHVCIFNVEASNVLAHAGPRMAEGAELMANCLRQYLGQNLETSVSGKS